MQIERRNQLLSLEQSRCHAIQHFLDRESSSDTNCRVTWWAPRTVFVIEPLVVCRVYKEAKENTASLDGR